jgi:hypothetical protein
MQEFNRFDQMASIYWTPLSLCHVCVCEGSDDGWEEAETISCLYIPNMITNNNR